MSGSPSTRLPLVETLPSGMPANPQYRKINPADAPVMVIALTSNTLGQGRLYDAASNILQQKISQVSGVGQVQLGGSSLPAVRVEINPTALNKYAIGLESVRAAIAAANANSPKGAIEHGDRRYQIYSNDQATTAEQYRSLIIAWRNGAPVRLSDVAEVIDSTEDIRNEGQANGKRSVLVIIYKQPNANIIETVDAIKALLPELQAAMPNDVDVEVVADRALANGDISEVQLHGGARVVSTPVQGEALEMRSEFLHAYLVTERVLTHLPVIVTTGPNELRADGLSYDHGRRLLELKGRQRALFSAPVAPAPRPEP